jgi:DNA-binding transcriptional LysR family regulator
VNINTRHLLCALKIKEFGTLTKAAEEVHLTQSALTQGINKLESGLGFKLFERSYSGMKLTEVGELFFARVKRAFEYLEEFSVTAFLNDKTKKQTFIRTVTSRQINALNYIVELGSYSAAAKSLGLSQPTLHRSIKDLEYICDQILFKRSPNGVEPTWRAKQLHRYGNLFFSELQQGIEEMHEFNGVINGHIRIGSLPLAQSEIVPLSILKLVTEYPEAKISIIDGPYAEQFNSLQHGQLDMIIGALREPLPNQEILQTQLFNNELSIVVRASHPLATQKIISTSELQQLDWVAPAKSTPARYVFSEIFKSRGVEPPSHVIECSSLVAVRGILLNSERAALLPAKQVDIEVKAGLLVVCPIILQDTLRQIGLTMRRTWYPTRMQRRFLDIVTSLTKVS